MAQSMMPRLMSWMLSTPWSPVRRPSDQRPVRWRAKTKKSAEKSAAASVSPETPQQAATRFRLRGGASSNALAFAALLARGGSSGAPSHANVRR